MLAKSGHAAIPRRALRRKDDLVYRHALDIDDGGQMLAFGSTTGSLWVSENGSNSWQTVSLNLPPIHSVRFERGG